MESSRQQEEAGSRGVLPPERDLEAPAPRASAAEDEGFGEGSPAAAAAPLVAGACPDEEAACRICLMGEAEGALLRPCSCSGTVAYTHVSCLRSWIQERGSATCELCREPFSAAALPHLSSDLAAAKERELAAHRLRQPNSQRGGPPPSEGDATAAAAGGGGGRYWWRVAAVLLLLAASVVALLLLGLHAHEAPWAHVLLRVIAFLLPALLAARAFYECYAIRKRLKRQRREEEEAAAAAIASFTIAIRPSHPHGSQAV